MGSIQAKSTDHYLQKRDTVSQVRQVWRGLGGSTPQNKLGGGFPPPRHLAPACAREGLAPFSPWQCRPGRAVEAERRVCKALPPSLHGAGCQAYKAPPPSFCSRVGQEGAAETLPLCLVPQNFRGGAG